MSSPVVSADAPARGFSLPSVRSVFLWHLRYGMVIFLAGMVIVTTILDHNFLDKANLFNLLRQWATPGLMAVGMTFVIISGGFDLSVGGTYAAAAVLSAGPGPPHSIF